MRIARARRPPIGAALMVTLLAASASAQGIAPLDRGWYSVAGTHDTQNYSYYLGNGPSTNDLYFRNWFVFDLTCVEGPVTGAVLELELWDDSFVSVDPTETYTLFDVTTPLDALRNGTGGVLAYADLGSGIPFGAIDLSAAHNGTVVGIPLDPAGVAALNAALGGPFGIGGALTTLDANPATSEVSFRQSQGLAVRLVLDPPCVVRDAFARGMYDDAGLAAHTGFYSLGNWPGVPELRHYLAFDLAAVDGLVTGATLALDHPYTPSGPAETYGLFEVTSSLPQLMAGTAGLAGFDDLGSGVLLGQRELTPGDGASLVTVPFDPAGLARVNAAVGGDFAVGGALITLDDDPLTVEQAFGSTAPAHSITQILLEVEPRWAWLGEGLAGTSGRVPLLLGTGELLGGDLAALQLSEALPGAPAWFVLGFELLEAPLKGGVLYPTPTILVGGLPVGPDGTLTVETVWPLGLPSGVSSYIQFWVQDPQGPVGLSASNGLRATTP